MIIPLYPGRAVHELSALLFTSNIVLFSKIFMYFNAIFYVYIVDFYI